MLQGRRINSHSKNAVQSAGSSPLFINSRYLTISGGVPQSACTQYLSKMCQNVSGDVRLLLGFAEDLITPQ